MTTIVLDRTYVVERGWIRIRESGYIAAQKSDLGIRVIVYVHNPANGVTANDYTPDMRKSITRNKDVLRAHGFAIPDVVDDAYPEEWFHL
ncbi:MAG: hypothetical protein AAB276_02380 [Pseudomonadota bacterium]